MVTPAQCDIWWAESEDKVRPVLVVTRSEVVPVIEAIMVAPITRTIRGIPTEVPLDSADGLSDDCVAVFDNLVMVRKSHLTERVGSISHRRYELCAALAAVASC